MKPVRLPFLVAALLVLGVLAGFALHQLITPRESKHEEAAPAEPDATACGNEEADDDTFLLGGEFGGSIIGADFSGAGFENEYGYPGRVMVWVEAMFLQVDTAELDSVLVGGEPTFRRGSEKLLLNSDEKEELLHQLNSKQSFRIISSVSVTSITGQQALMQVSEEVPYLTQTDSGVSQNGKPSAGAAGSEEEGSFYVEPFEIEELQVGSRLNVTATVSLDGVITLVLLPEVSQITGWAVLADRPPVPVYRCWDVTTTLYCRDGMSILMASAPLSSFGGAPHPSMKSEAKGLGEKTLLLLITARLIEIPAVDGGAERVREEAPEAADSTEADRSPLPF